MPKATLTLPARPSAHACASRAAVAAPATTAPQRSGGTAAAVAAPEKTNTTRLQIQSRRVTARYAIVGRLEKVGIAIEEIVAETTPASSSWIVYTQPAFLLHTLHAWGHAHARRAGRSQVILDLDGGPA